VHVTQLWEVARYLLMSGVVLPKVTWQRGVGYKRDCFRPHMTCTYLGLEGVWEGGVVVAKEMCVRASCSCSCSRSRS
jgi:hypothetical protein